MRRKSVLPSSSRPLFLASFQEVHTGDGGRATVAMAIGEREACKALLWMGRKERRLYEDCQRLAREDRGF